jgi:hypothetical protein
MVVGDRWSVIGRGGCGRNTGAAHEPTSAKCGQMWGTVGFEIQMWGTRAQKLGPG